MDIRYSAEGKRRLAGKQQLLTAWFIAGVAAAQAQPVPMPGAAPPGGSRRDDIKVMEVVLTNAVKNGADALARQMQFRNREASSSPERHGRAS